MRWRAGQVDQHVDPLLFHAQRRHLGERRRLHAAHAPLQHARATPAFDAHGTARAHLQRIGGQQRRHHFELRGVAHLDQHGAQRHHTFADLRHAQHTAGDGGQHLEGLASRGAAGALHYVERSAGLGQIGAGHLLFLHRGVGVFFCRLQRQAIGVEPRGGHKALLRQLFAAPQVVAGLRLRHPAAFDAHGSALHIGLGGRDAGLLLAQAALVQQGRHGGGDARHHVARLHRIALTQRNARQPPGQRGRDAVAVAQAGLCVFIDACLEAALHHGGGLHLQRTGCKCPRQQCAQQHQRTHTQHQRFFCIAMSLLLALFALLAAAYSRVLSAPTMSSRSICRRTTRALARPAATTHNPAQA